MHGSVGGLGGVERDNDSWGRGVRGHFVRGAECAADETRHRRRLVVALRGSRKREHIGYADQRVVVNRRDTSDDQKQSDDGTRDSATRPQLGESAHQRGNDASWTP